MPSSRRGGPLADPGIEPVCLLHLLQHRRTFNRCVTQEALKTAIPWANVNCLYYNDMEERVMTVCSGYP